MKKVFAQIVLALLFGATAYVLLAGVDGVWAQDVTAEPVAVTAEPAVVPDAPVVVVNVPAAQPAPEESTANQLYTVLIVALSAVAIVVTVVRGLANKVPVAQLDTETAMKVDTYHLQHIATLEKQIDGLRDDNRALLKNVVAALDAFSKFTPIKTDDRLAELGKDAVDGLPSTFGQDAVG